MYPPLLRPVWWVVAHTLYRFKVHHRDRVPATGGVLVVANHVTYLDWLLLWVACPRPVTFVLWGSYYRNPLLRFFLSWVRHHTIRIDDRITRPHAVAEGLQRIADALDAGKLVVMFPEGKLTRSGNMRPFGRGVEYVLKKTRTDVAVIPTALSGLWCGFFSHGGGPIMRKLPKAFRPRVGVLIGKVVKRPNPPAPFPRREGGEGHSGSKSSCVSESITPLAPPSLVGKGAGGLGLLSAPNLRLAVQEATAELAVIESDQLLLVHRRFLRHATKFRHLFKPAVVDNSGGPARTLTWAKLLVAALCVTRYLRTRLGDAPNVGIWLPTGLGSALTNFAVAFLGKSSVNLNYTAGTAAVRSAVKQADVRVIITAKKFLARVPLDLPEDVQQIHLEDVLESVTKWQRIRTFLAVLLFPGWVIDRWLGLHRHKLDDTLTIVFSSGSTGEPKGVVLTHRNIASNTDSAIRTLEIGPGEVLFGILPFFHSFGYTVCLWAPMCAPCTAVYFPDPRQAKEVGELARINRATIIAATATFLRFYIRRCGSDDFRSLRLIVCGAEKLPVKLQDDFRDKFGVLPLEGYGCTELSPIVSVNLTDVTHPSEPQQRNYRGTVG